MAKRIAARDAEIWETAGDAVRRLVNVYPSGLVPRDIFGDARREHWVQGFLRRLTEAGLCRCQEGLGEGRQNRARTYFATPALGAFTDDATRLEEFIWPRGQMTLADVSSGDEDEASGDEELPTMEMPSRDDEPPTEKMPETDIGAQLAWIAEKHSLSEKVDALLKLSLATFEVVDSLKTEIEGLKRAWE